MFTMKRMKNNISLKNLLKLACILRAKKRRKFHVSINWWKLVYTLYVIYAKGNAGGKIQKNVKKLILLTPFYLKLGKKFESSFFPPREWKYLKRWGLSCECLSTALEWKSVCFSVSNISKIFCLEKEGMCYYFQCASCKKNVNNETFALLIQFSLSH